MGINRQKTFIILDQFSVRLVTCLEFISTPVWVSNISVLTVCFTFINFTFQIFPLFLREMSTSFTSCIFQIICINLVLSCNHSNFACFLWPAVLEHSSSNLDFFCFLSYLPIMSLAEILFFPLVLHQAIFISPKLYTFSLAANLFAIWMSYYFIASRDWVSPYELLFCPFIYLWSCS